MPSGPTAMGDGAPEALVSSPSPPPSPPRRLTAGERRYVLSLLGNDRAGLIVVLAIVGTLGAGLLGLSVWAAILEGGASWLLPLLPLGLFFPIVLYCASRLRPPAHDGLAHTVWGVFHVERVDVGEMSADVPYVGDLSVVLPDHWKARVRQGELVRAEVCIVPARGWDLRFYGPRRGYVLALAVVERRDAPGAT